MNPGLCVRTWDVDCTEVRDDVSVGLVRWIADADCGDAVGGFDGRCEGGKVEFADSRVKPEVMVLLMRKVSQS